jgi:hypothetical protein
MPTAEPLTTLIEPQDPLGALIYYYCITEAVKAGDLVVPSSRVISNRLQITRTGAERRAIDQEVQHWWEDLQWINEQGVLFNERPHTPEEFIVSLSQHNVNRRIQRFHRGFEQVTKRTRRLVLSQLVDKAITACRLAALKDLYHFHDSELPHKLFCDFALQAQLFADSEQLYSFLQAMVNIAYLAVSPTQVATTLDASIPFLIEPTDTFRSLDMFIELRALDHWTDDKRQEQRIELKRKAKAFAENQH